MNTTKKEIIKKIYYYLERYNELRFLQLLINALETEFGRDIDLYYLTDEELLRALNNYELTLK